MATWSAPSRKCRSDAIFLVIFAAVIVGLFFGGLNEEYRGAAQELRAGGRQIDTQPARIGQAGADALSQDRARPAGDRKSTDRSVCRGPRASAAADHPRSRCHRRPAAWRPGGPLLPRLLRLLLLPAALHLLRPAPLGGQIAPFQHRRQRRGGRGGGAHRRPPPRPLAAGAHPVRADAGFAREELMHWCEHNSVDFLFGLAKNARLTAAIAAELAAARQHSEQTGKPARRFKDFTWSTLDSWSRTRRVIGKAEWTGGEANPRFVVTSLARNE